jgi:aminoglycoside phosphotransferase family enzyme
MVRDDVITGGVEEPTLDQKVDFLSRSSAYGPSVTGALSRETHMSWVFLAGDRVYKLKKPVRFPYLDFSTLRRREAACRAELRLNRRLAPDVYLDVVPLTATPRGLAIGGDAKVVDWLVVMRRLDEAQTLEHAILEDRLAPWQLDRLIATLVQFYRRAEPVFLSPAVHLRDWLKSLADNRRVLLDPRLGLPSGLIRRIASSQAKFLSEQSRALAKRVCERGIIDGHGDLRPEHIWLGDPVRIIDCLEFNPRLRAVDPFDEIAFLSLECDRLGAGWAGKYIARRVMRGLRDGLSEELFLFYRGHRAMLRARLAIAHLLEPNPRTPDKWPRLARAYLRIAAADAIRLERSLKRQANRPAQSPPPASGSLRQQAAPREARRPCRARPGWQAGTAARRP